LTIEETGLTNLDSKQLVVLSQFVHFKSSNEHVKKMCFHLFAPPSDLFCTLDQRCQLFPRNKDVFDGKQAKICQILNEKAEKKLS